MVWCSTRFIPFGGAGRGPGTGQRFRKGEIRLSLTFWETVPGTRRLKGFIEKVTGIQNQWKV